MDMKTNYSEFMVIFFTSTILLILFIPIPARMLDFLIVLNFSWAMTILFLSFHTDKPLGFSTFPALLLLSTLFRLALNISATRLILANANAGQVIAAVGHYVIQENYAMGLVVFIIIIIVQFIVVTNGAQRVAEVAARFTLDSMPGKQMAIDADLNMGLISQDTARTRRAQIEKEANFYGAMDGASKFVKGDAIAGILIVLVDLVGGFFIGMVEKSMSLWQAIHSYSLLTVGDGLVTQIPALIISTATGIIVTRAATDANLGGEVSKQITAYPRSLNMVALCLLLLLIVKGMPFLPIITVFSLFTILIIWSRKNSTIPEIPKQEESVYDKIKVFPLLLEFHPQLFQDFTAHADSFGQQIQQLREHIALEYGLVIPEIHQAINVRLAFPFYRISVQGIEDKCHPLYLQKLLAIRTRKTENTPNFNNAIAVADPAFGLPSAWINRDQRELAEKHNYSIYEPLTVLITHIKDKLQEQLAQLLTRDGVENLLAQNDLRTLRDELIPSLLSMTQIQKILQNLLVEKVSIRPLSLILETLVENARTNPDLAVLTSVVRIRLAASICQKLANAEGIITVLTLDPSLENKLWQGLDNQQIALDPSLAERLINSLGIQVEKMLQERHRPILLCSTQIRMAMRLFTQRILPHLTVIALNEIPLDLEIVTFATIN